MSLKPSFAIAAALLTALAAARPSPTDLKFARDASQGNAAEVALGRLAAQRGGSADIRRFGSRMVSDHGAAQAQLARIARAKGIPLPVSLKPDAQRLYQRLSLLRGAAFDRLYRREMIEDHRKDIAEFQRESRRGSDAQIRGFAVKTTPTLRMHLQMIQTARV